jgi:hypothetical protein
MSIKTDTGIPGVGHVAWGKHLCHFYRTRDDLLHSIVPYFVAGLLNNERCFVGAASPLYGNEIQAELARRVPDLSDRLQSGQITIFDHHDWYVGNASRDPVADLLEVEKKALARGYAGLRCGGNISWITRKDWLAFRAYEEKVTRILAGRRIVAVCSYDLTRCEGVETFEAIQAHHYTVARHAHDWELLETTARSRN